MAEPMTPFKEMFNPDAARWLAERMQIALPTFRSDAFLGEVLPRLGALELKARVEMLAVTLVGYLPKAFSEVAPILLAALEPDPGPPEGEAFGSFRYMPLARVVSLLGLEQPDLALPVLYELTKRFSVEFDIRYFLEKYEGPVLATLLRWADDPDWRIRRLVSEGSRPRLPWGMQLRAFVANPELTLPLLERLRLDPHSAVQRSVANHFNDMAKDHPERVVEVLERWLAEPGPGTAGLARHALRSLIKAGNSGAMRLLGFDTQAALEVVAFRVTPEVVRVGGAVTLEAVVRNPGSESVRLLLDYVVQYRKADGKQGPKVFKWTTRTLGPGERVVLTKQHSFKPVTTRVLYPGAHRIGILVNGRVAGEGGVQLEPGGVGQGTKL